MRTEPFDLSGTPVLLDRPDMPLRGLAILAHDLADTTAARLSRPLTRRGYAVLRFTPGADAGATIAAALAARPLGDNVHTILIGHGESGAAALAVAAERPDVLAVATLGAPFPEALKDAIHGLHRDLLILHSPRDEVVSVDHASRIFLAAKHPKSFMSLEPADHRLTGARDADCAGETIAAWAARFIDEVPPPPEDEHVFVRDTGVGKFQVQVSASGTTFLADEPVSVGGGNSGPTPYQLLAGALGACTAMTVKMYAGQKSWPLEGIAVRVAHAKEKGATPADLFSREIALEGPLDAEQKARLMEIADRCPVHRTLETGSRVATMPMDPPAEPPVEPPAQHTRDMEAACAD
jgi:uncharacterized OsmC-like protein